MLSFLVSTSCHMSNVLSIRANFYRNMYIESVNFNLGHSKSLKINV